MSEIVKQQERSVPRYRPATDILEREDGFHVLMDLPGVAKENLSIDLQNDELVIKGKSSLVAKEFEDFSEMQFGECEYYRSIAISDIVDREQIKANLDGGVLELLLPKVEKIKPKRIEIIQN